MTELTADSIVAHGDDAVAADVGDEIVVLNARRGLCYSLNKTASRIWQLTDQPVAISDLCASLTAGFDVDPARCEADILSLLGRLQAEDLVKSVAPLNAAHAAV